MTSVTDWHARLVGTEFPPGALRVEPYEDWLARDAIGADQSEDGLLHPSWILNGALRGAGYGLGDIIELCGASWADGVLFGEARVEQIEPLRSSTDYTVVGCILDVQRRTGRRVPAFDLVTYEMRIEHGGSPVGRCVNTFVIPREVGA